MRGMPVRHGGGSGAFLRRRGGCGCTGDGHGGDHPGHRHLLYGLRVRDGPVQRFTAFNQVVQESGLDLGSYKGKTVEKWTLLCPQLSTGDEDTYCVLLVYKTKPVGAYLLEKPSGEVSGLVTAAKTAAEADGVEIEYPED